MNQCRGLMLNLRYGDKLHTIKLLSILIVIKTESHATLSRIGISVGPVHDRKSTTVTLWEVREEFQR